MSFAASTQPQVAGLTGRDTLLGSLGSYFSGSNPTPGTGIVTGNPTSLVATTPALVVYNGGSSADIHLHYLRLMSTVVGGGAATKQFTHFVDQGNRYTSGGTALTIKNTNPLSTTTSNAVATFGVLVATAASSAQRQIGNGWFRVALADVVGDVYEFQYGSSGMSTFGSTPATVCAFTRAMPPIVLPPNSSYILNIWSATFTAGITFEVELGFSER